MTLGHLARKCGHDPAQRAFPRERDVDAKATREPMLSPVDRVSEMHLGLSMALTFVGAVTVAESGRQDLRKMFAAALGCNLA
ncbi:hypothetical protein [Variovorax sp. J22R115]|uniref:hypothetical protein n=1 Tax=Variovorax sp. J22R115 TaxID=3053509 RepID=UPI0025749CF2|nr:hypothetical protein [Variovorax sp. J22R115]MDM0047626.1 hypothetical protein [Variovorax sp. J22R115]